PNRRPLKNRFAPIMDVDEDPLERNRELTEQMATAPETSGAKRSAWSPPPEPQPKRLIKKKDMMSFLKARMIALEAENAAVASQGPFLGLGQPQSLGPSTPEPVLVDSPTQTMPSKVSLQKKFESLPDPSEVTALQGQGSLASSGAISTFPLRNFPAKNTLLPCAFGTLVSTREDGDVSPWLIGSLYSFSSQWALHLRVDAGRYGSPCITLRIQVAKYPKEHRQEHNDNMYLQWFVHPCKVADEQQVWKIDLKPFTKWFGEASEQSRALSAIREVTSGDDSNKAVILTCRLQYPVVKEFSERASWGVLPSHVQTNVEGLEGSRQVDFLCVADNTVRDQIMPLLCRQVEKRLPILHQYNDYTTGSSTLLDIDDALDVHEVGFGMYVDVDGTIHQLPMLNKYLFLRQFRVYTALPPVRDAKFLNCREPFQKRLDAVHRFCDSDHPSVVKFRQLLMTGRISKRTPETRLSLCGSSHKNVKFLQSLTSMIRDDLKDDMQMSFLRKLTDVENNTLALVGPAGSGKSKVLSLTIWILLLFGHKIFVCAVDKKALKNLLLD
ncbi:MAG: hypothetical protein Q9224_006627, partial [Gallowayella concinna]